MGQLIAAGVLKGCSTIDGQWSYRIPFAIQWLWIPFIAVGTLYAPESPWWLVRKGRYDEARKSLLILTNTECGVPFDADATLSMIKATNEMEAAIDGGTSYRHCFTGIDIRRTEIASMAWLAQAFCGAALVRIGWSIWTNTDTMQMGYSVQFYIEAGMDESNSLSMNLGQYAMGFCGTVGSWFLMRYVRRRALYLYGLMIMFTILVIVGGLGIVSRENVGAQWGIGSLLLVYTFVYDITVGPVCYCLVSEIPSTLSLIHI